MKYRLIACFAVCLSLLSCSSDSPGDGEVTPPPPPPAVDPPGIAVLSAPENNEVCEEGVSVSDSQSTVNFDWTSGNNTDSFDLQIVNLNTNQVINQNNISESNKTVTLSKGTPYSWKIISKRQGTASTAESSTWQFYLASEGINAYPPYPTALISPSSGISFDSTTTSVELSWNGTHPEGLALTFDVYIDTIDGLQEPESSFKNLSESSIDVDVSSGTSYYWRIKATDTNNNSSYSIVYSFAID